MTDAYRYRCLCGQTGRWYRNPNDAVGAGEAHLGLDRQRHPCPHGYTSESALRMERREGSTITTERF